MSTTDVNIAELERAGLLGKGSDYDGMIGESVKELLLLFQKQGHSGASAAMTVKIFYELVQCRPLTALTNNSEEWTEVSPKLFQSRRSSHVFIDRSTSDQPFTFNGKAFSDDGGRSFFTNSESKVYFDLPGFPPETQYIILDKLWAP